jgi:mannose-6-phosphate isomerase-like protein (cupin superfamily)
LGAKLRRVVVGHDSHGQAIVLSDGEPEIIVNNPASGFYSAQMWVTDSAPVALGAGLPHQAQQLAFVPPQHGSTMRVIQFPPEDKSIYKIDASGAKKLFALLGGENVSTYNAHGPHPLMHRTESLDYGIVLEGEITMILDETEIVLKTGDVLVHLGTSHAWRNHSENMCRMAFILIDGKFEKDLFKGGA